MTFRIKSAVAVAAFLSLMLLGACGPTEEATNDDGETTPVASNGDGGEVDLSTVDLSTVDLKAAVATQMDAATANGTYDCCLAMPCKQCLVMMGACPCEANAKSDGEVCHECKGGWDAGGGDIEGMTTDDINVMPRMIMDMDGM